MDNADWEVNTLRQLKVKGWNAITQVACINKMKGDFS